MRFSPALKLRWPYALMAIVAVVVLQYAAKSPTVHSRATPVSSKPERVQEIHALPPKTPVTQGPQFTLSAREDRQVRVIPEEKPNRRRVSTEELENLFEDVTEYPNDVRRVYTDGKFGFVDAYGNYLVEPVLDVAFDFTLGLTAASMDGKFGYLNAFGTWVVQPTLDYAWPLTDEGIGLVRKNDKYGYLNAKGDWIFPPKLDEAFGYAEGLSPVSLNGRFGFIDKTGAWVVPAQYDYAWPFSGGIALVKQADRLWYIDLHGNFAKDL